MQLPAKPIQYTQRLSKCKSVLDDLQEGFDQVNGLALGVAELLHQAVHDLGFGKGHADQLSCRNLRPSANRPAW